MRVSRALAANGTLPFRSGHRRWLLLDPYLERLTILDAGHPAAALDY